MANRASQKWRPASQAKQDKDDQTTRDRLLEAAGRVFAEHGFDRATGKEICDLAGTNTAAINYYFGGIERLYIAVIEEANRRLVTLDALSAAVADQADAKTKLEAIIGLLVRTLTGPASSSWAMRVLGREVVAPSPALDELREKEFLPRSRILRGIVSELMGVPQDHPAVARGCVSVMAPCFMLLVCDRRILKRMFPRFGLGSEDADAVTGHLVRFALAGLAAIGSDARSA
jgi:AcrR family transcriptional regulator